MLIFKQLIDTVNVVIFTGGNFAKMLCWQDISLEGSFQDSTPISVIKAYSVLFKRWGNFREEDKSAKKRENYPHAKISTFTV